MVTLARPALLTVAVLSLGSFSPAEQPAYSAALLAYLDPSARLASLCGGRDGAASMRAKLMVAAAAVQAAEPPRVTLDPGLGKVHLAVTTGSPLAQRYFDQGLSYGWALYGLAAAERAQGRRAPAMAAEAALRRAWAGDRRWLRIERI